MIFLQIFTFCFRKQRFFLRQSHGKTPFIGPFYLFSEQVPARGIIGIGLFQRKSRKCRKFVWNNSFNSWRLGRLAGRCKLKLLWVRSIYLLLNLLGLGFCTVISNGQVADSCTAAYQLKAVWAVQSAIKKIRSCWVILRKTSKISPKTYVTPLDVYSKHQKVDFWIILTNIFIYKLLKTSQKLSLALIYYTHFHL